MDSSDLAFMLSHLQHTLFVAIQGSILLWLLLQATDTVEFDQSVWIPSHAVHKPKAVFAGEHDLQSDDYRDTAEWRDTSEA